MCVTWLRVTCSRSSFWDLRDGSGQDVGRDEEYGEKMDNHYIISWAEGHSQAVTWVVKSKRRETFFPFFKEKLSFVSESWEPDHMICCKRVQIVQQMLCLWLYLCLEQLHGLCASMLFFFFMLSWRVWAFSTCRIVGVSARKSTFLDSLGQEHAKAPEMFSSSVIPASPTAILAEHISLNNVTNGLPNLLEQDCVGMLYFMQV